MAKPNPSFLKRQKEQARKEKAEAKRSARANKKTNAEGEVEGEEELQLLDGTEAREPDPNEKS